MKDADTINRLQAYVEKTKAMLANPPERRKGLQAFTEFLNRELRKTQKKIDNLRIK
jgi:hypothetical protein